MNTDDAFARIRTIIEGKENDPAYDPRPQLIEISRWAEEYATRGQQLMGGVRDVYSIGQKVSKIVLTMVATTADEEKQSVAFAARMDPDAMGNLLYTCVCIAAAVAEEVIGKTNDLSDVPAEFRSWQSKKEDNDGPQDGS